MTACAGQEEEEESQEEEECGILLTFLSAAARIALSILMYFIKTSSLYKCSFEAHLSLLYPVSQIDFSIRKSFSKKSMRFSKAL